MAAMNQNTILSDMHCGNKILLHFRRNTQIKYVLYVNIFDKYKYVKQKHILTLSIKTEDFMSLKWYKHAFNNIRVVNILFLLLFVCLEAAALRHAWHVVAAVAATSHSLEPIKKSRYVASFAR